MERYERLKAELPEMAAVLGKFPEALQARAFEVLVTEFLGPSAQAKGSDAGGQGPKERERPLESNDKEIPGVAFLDGETIRFTIRDPKADSAADAVQRLAYVAIRTAQLLTKQEKISSRRVLVPLLKDFRLYNGGGRARLAGDRGISRDGDLLWLDTPATQQADGYIRMIQNPETTGTWKPGTRRRAGKKDAVSDDDDDDAPDVQEQ